MTKRMLWPALALVTLLGLDACRNAQDALTPRPDSLTQTTDVTASPWRSVTPADWITDAQHGSATYVGFIENKLTPNVVQEGLVMVYYRQGNRTGILPATVDGVAYDFTYHANKGRGVVGISKTNVSNVVATDEAEPVHFRWVVVPREQLQAANWQWYNDVRQRLDLAD